jgi:hypothetical protein
MERQHHLDMSDQDSRRRSAHTVGSKERDKASELEGQTSINDLLDEPVGKYLMTPS